MKFYEHETLYEYNRRTNQLQPGVTKEAFYECWINTWLSRESEINKQIKKQIGVMAHDDSIFITPASRWRGQMESDWYSNYRQYYKVWPSVIAALLRIPLNLEINQYNLPEQMVIAARFAYDHPLKVSDFILYSCLYVLTKERNEKILFVSPSYYSETFMRRFDTVPFCIVDGAIVDVQINRYVATDINLKNISSKLIQLQCLKLGITLMILSNDPSIIQPDVLAADRNRFDRSTDPEERQRLIDKAKRRGIVGWRIGEQYETMPHYRRPHFGLRHTGKGKTVPRIVPIKGAIVHRQKMTQVPTGYLLEDGTEIED